MFNDDLTSNEDGSECDIVCDNSPTGFGLHIEEDLVYCHDHSYVKTHIHKEPTHIPNNNGLIDVVMQGMHGNRTSMRLKKEDIDHYILGYLDTNITITEEIDKSIIHIPNSQCVIVYNKY